MAGSAVIGALRVVLGADTAHFDTALGKASSGLKTFQAQAARAGAAIGVAMVATAAAIGVGLKSAFDAADNLGKAAQKIGIPVEELAQLKHAADLSGVSFESLQKGTAKLSRAMVEASAGGVGPAALAFKTLGISVKNSDGTLKSSSVVMTEIAGRFAGMNDGAAKTALAIKLFGKAGADMIPLLNAGKVGLAAMMAEALALGLVISTKTAKAAEGFNDNLTRLSRVKDGIFLQLTAKLAPAFEHFTNQLVEAAKNSGLVETIASSLANSFQNLARAALVVYDNSRLLVMAFGALIAVKLVTAVVGIGMAFIALSRTLLAVTGATLIYSVAKQFLTTKMGILTGVILAGGIALAGYTGALEKASGAIADLLPKNIGQQVAGVLESMGINLRGLALDFNNLGDGAAGITPKLNNVNTSLLAGKNALDQFFSSTTKQIAAQNADAAAVGLSIGARERLRVVMAAEAVAQENNIRLTDAQRMRMTELANAAEQAALRLAGANLTQESLLPWQQYEQQLLRIQQLYDGGHIRVEAYGNAMRNAAEKAGTSWDIAGASIAGSFATIAGSFGEENKKMATAAKGFSIVQAIISAYTGAAKALELPFPANLAAAAGVLAKGFAFVASIKSTAVPKFASGGSFTIPGGMGGSDSKTVPITGFPGERVTVERPSPFGGDKGSSAPRELTLTFPDRLMREFWANGIEQINGLVRDGYRLKVA